MSRFEAPPGIITNGLVLNLDAGDPDSYTRSQPPYVEVLVVAGGGGGGMDMGGGGGGGGVIYNSAYQITSATAITVTVGNGGVGAPAGGTNGQPSYHQFTISATAGANSVFGSLTAVGGGYGASSYYGYTPNYGYPGNGGSGGGPSGYSDGGYRNGGTGTAGQGFDGGRGGPQYYSGGGGGAGGKGVDSTNQPSGGPGILYSILGTGYYWGGGGGGASYSSTPGGNGGIGGGGGGAVGTTTGGAGYNNGQAGGGGTPNNQTNTPGGDAGANTGGGGGGGSHYNLNNKGGNGGSGIVIVRYPGLPAATGGTITYVNGYTIHTFTTSGTFTPYLINDITGNGFNGTLENGVGFNSYQNGGGLIFDGSDDRIPVASSNNFGNYSWSSGITVMVAYYIDNILDFQGVFRALLGVTGANRSFNYYLYGPNANSGLLMYHFSTNYGSGLSGNVPISNNSWYIATFTSNGTTGTYYHNNIAIATQGMSTQSYTTAGGLQYFGAADNYWKGKIGYWLIYNRALSVSEITQNYNATKARFGL
jgi:hypothetical protein